MHALIYTKDKEIVALSNLLGLLGYVCHWETDLTQVSQHIKIFSPTLILNNMEDVITPPELPENGSFYPCLREFLIQQAALSASLDQESWHFALCEVFAHETNLALWYVADAQFLKSVLNRFTLRTAQAVMDDLEAEFTGKAYSSADRELQQSAELATIKLLIQLHKFKLVGREGEHSDE